MSCRPRWMTDTFVPGPTMNRFSIIAWTAIVLTLTLFVAQRVRSWQCLRHVKGPAMAAWSKWWMIRRIAAGRMHLELAEVCEKYGSLARIGPHQLVTSDAEILRRMLGVRSPYRRSDWYVGMRLDPNRDNVLSERNDGRHNALRAKMAPGYSGKENEHLEQTINNNIARLVNLISTKYVSTSTHYKPLDFGRKAQYFTLDVISELSFGSPFGYIDSDSDVNEYIKTTEETLPVIIMVTILPLLNSLLQSSLLRSIVPSPEDHIGVGRVIGLAKRVVAERFGPHKKRQRDMLGSFIHHGLTQDEAESETLVQILAGSDTTATAIRATLLHIITSPRVSTLLINEIHTFAPSTPISDAEARQMPYLQAVIKEGLRIFPPVTGLMSKEVPPGGDMLNGKFIPPGTKIGYCAWGIFRNVKTWGADSGVFRPERWLEGSPENIREKELALELVFAHGRWQCLGKNVALIELNKVFVELLRNFEFDVVDPTKPWTSINYGIFMQYNMWLRVSKREEL